MAQLTAHLQAHDVVVDAVRFGEPLKQPAHRRVLDGQSCSEER
jgi:hypothetical protein